MEDMVPSLDVVTILIVNIQEICKNVFKEIRLLKRKNILPLVKVNSHGKEIVEVILANKRK